MDVGSGWECIHLFETHPPKVFDRCVGMEIRYLYYTFTV